MNNKHARKKNRDRLDSPHDLYIRSVRSDIGQYAQCKRIGTN